MNAKGKFLAACFIVLAFMSVSAVAQKTIPLAPFTSVELRNGGKVFLSHGATQRVTLLKGSQDYTQLAIVDGDRLVIDDGKFECPRGYELEIEIVTPGIAGISVKDGGVIQSRRDFSPQAEIKVAVSSGGTIDIRSMAVNRVTASVNSGGIIFTKPRTAMVASVVDGGIVTYWGNAQVIKSIRRGGVITRGSAEDYEKQLFDVRPAVPVLPAIPTVPSIRPVLIT